ncbi:MAG: hypothetical protein ACREUZ_21460 [Burkholderiales bacterium]
MEYGRALSQIAEIHQQLAKGEIYRGYRSIPVAASGLVGAAAAALQPAPMSADPAAFLRYWVAIAALAGSVGLIEVAYNYVVHDDASGRRRTRQVLGQFLPATLGAATISVAFLHVSPRMVAVLPGVWAICFALAILASRPYLPGTSALVAFFYFAAGSFLLWTTNVHAALNGWAVGATFGVGQLLAAAVLYFALESPSARRHRS